MTLSRAAYIIIFLIGLSFGLFLQSTIQPDLKMVKQISCETGFRIYVSRYQLDVHPIAKLNRIRYIDKACKEFSEMEI